MNLSRLTYRIRAYLEELGQFTTSKNACPSTRRHYLLSSPREEVEPRERLPLWHADGPIFC